MADAPAPPTPPAGGNPPNPPPRSPARWIGLGILGLLFVFGYREGVEYTVKNFTHESTDDAFLEAPVVAVAPKVAGHVLAVHVVDNQFVRQGDPLLEIDPRDYEVRLTQKKDSVASADANLESSRAGVELVKARYDTAQATERQQRADADAARAKADRAQADLKRSELLRQTGVISSEEFDRVRADADSTAADLRSAEQKASAGTSQVAEAKAQISLALAMLQSAVTKAKQARSDQEGASLDLSYTRIVAPGDGRVTRKAVEPGDYVQVGQSLFALVPTNCWVSANFKENQLTDMRPGQSAEIRLDAYPDRQLRGHVDSIMAGTGARFSLLPPENAVGNFVKIVQRVPVKIVFDEPLDPAFSLGPGMSVVPSVRTSDFTLAPVWIWVAAVVLAVLTTLGLARVLAHLRD